MVDFENPDAERLYQSVGFERADVKDFLGHKMWHLVVRQQSTVIIHIEARQLNQRIKHGDSVSWSSGTYKFKIILMIRKAKENDIPKILDLLSQVNDVHAEGRPDFFIKGRRKYNEADLMLIINDGTTSVFVCEEDNDVKGYAFCVIQDLSKCHNLHPDKSLYIDDICVDEKYRRHGVGRKLYDFVMQYAKNEGCFNVTLNVWDKNPEARAFYENMGMKVQKVCMEVVL